MVDFVVGRIFVLPVVVDIVGGDAGEHSGFVKHAFVLGVNVVYNSGANGIAGGDAEIDELAKVGTEIALNAIKDAFGFLQITGAVLRNKEMQTGLNVIHTVHLRDEAINIGGKFGIDSLEMLKALTDGGRAVGIGDGLGSNLSGLTLLAATMEAGAEKED